MAFYTKIREEHWLRDKLEEGRIVILEDESIWEVHPWDRQITKRWLRISTITVKHTEKEGYPYLLLKQHRGRRCAGQLPRRVCPDEHHARSGLIQSHRTKVNA